MKVALIGAGAWGRNLARVLAELGVLTAVCEADPFAGQQAATRHGVRHVAAVDELLDDPDIAAVVIASPAATHARLCAAALDAGKDVFVEKPMALTGADAARLTALAAERGRVLMVGHLLRYHPAFLTLQELVREGALGQLRHIASRRLSLGRLRTEENILWSFAPHDISMILALAGNAPERVDAHGATPLGTAIPDLCTAHFAFPGGLTAEISVSWLHPVKEQALTVVGDRAMAVFDDTAPAERKLTVYDHRVEWRDGQPVAVKAEGRSIPLPPGEPLRAEMEHFLDCCRTRAVPRTDGAEGERVLAVLAAAQASMEQHMTAPHPSAPPPPNRFPNAVLHPTVEVDAGVSIGDRTRIWHFSHILPNARIGADCSIGQNCCVGAGVTIGDGCKIQNNVSIYEAVTLEDGVFCGPSCVFTNVMTPRAFVNRKHEFLPTLVRTGASIGANATIVCGTTLGRYCLIGAGAVVIQDVPDHALMVGNPARRIGWVSKAGERLGPDLVCPRSGERYEETSDGRLRELTAPAE